MRYETGNPEPGDPKVKTRDVEVYGLGEEYFDAYCYYRGEVRTFKISRVLTARLTDKTFQIPLEAMELGEFEKDEILDRLNNIKRLRREDEVRLNDLLKTREHIASLADAKVKLSKLYDRVLENLQNSTSEIKALALDALDIKVYARGTDNVEIQGVIPLELPTIAQTSGCLSSHAYEYLIPFG
ncbi:unnamed protein product, partial [marine sediment metagenome]